MNKYWINELKNWIIQTVEIESVEDCLLQDKSFNKYGQELSRIIYRASIMCMAFFEVLKIQQE